MMVEPVVAFLLQLCSCVYAQVLVIVLPIDVDLGHLQRVEGMILHPANQLCVQLLSGSRERVGANPAMLYRQPC